ncbi:unnamed protein product, partial [Closterium sp. NIES-53]
SSPGVTNASDSFAFGMPSSKYMAHASQFSQSISQSYPSASQGSQVKIKRADFDSSSFRRPICLSNPRNETTGGMWPMSLQNDQNWKTSQGDFMSMLPSPPALE